MWTSQQHTMEQQVFPYCQRVVERSSQSPAICSKPRHLSEAATFLAETVLDAVENSSELYDYPLYLKGNNLSSTFGHSSTQAWTQKS